MRPVYFSTFNLGRKAEPAPALDEFVEMCRKWLCAERPGVSADSIKAVDFTAAGTTQVGDSAIVEVLRHSEDGNDWFGARLEHPDAEAPKSRWQVEVTGVRGPEGGGGLRVAIATGFLHDESFMPVTRATARPRLVADVVDRFGAYEGHPILARSQRVTPDNVERFVEALFSPERKLPIVFFSAYSFKDQPVADPRKSAEALVGLAHVYAAMNRYPSFELTSSLGRELSCFEGAVRVYWPGMGRGDDPYKHPLFIRSKVIEIDERNPGGLAAFLLSRICRVAVARRPARALRWQEIEKRIAAAAIRAARGTGDERQLAEMLDRENRGLAERVKALEDENLELEEEVQRLSAVADQWRQAYEEERKKGRGGAKDTKATPLAPPEDVEEAVERAKKDFPRLKVALVSSSFVKGNPFKDPASVYGALRFLATTYADSKLGKRECADLRLACREECGFEFKSHQSEITMKAYESEYYATWNGERVPLEEHVGKGVSKDPQHSIRIAFHFDKKEGVVVVGFIGQHQRTDQT